MFEPKLNFYKTHPSIKTPQYGTEQSACMDLEYNAVGKQYVLYYELNNPIIINSQFIDSRGGIEMVPDRFYMLPTGIIFDIPAGYSVRVYPRSSTCLKYGLVLANNVGIIDSDYVEETFMIFRALKAVRIDSGTRLAQFELVKIIRPDCNIITEKPKQKTDRSGGYGSTGH